MSKRCYELELNAGAIEVYSGILFDKEEISYLSRRDRDGMVTLDNDIDDYSEDENIDYSKQELSLQSVKNLVVDIYENDDYNIDFTVNEVACSMDEEEDDFLASALSFFKKTKSEIIKEDICTFEENDKVRYIIDKPVLNKKYLKLNEFKFEKETGLGFAYNSFEKHSSATYSFEIEEEFNKENLIYLTRDLSKLLDNEIYTIQSIVYINDKDFLSVVDKLKKSDKEYSQALEKIVLQENDIKAFRKEVLELLFTNDFTFYEDGRLKNPFEDYEAKANISGSSSSEEAIMNMMKFPADSIVKQ